MIFQGDFYSTALKTLISVSTMVLLGLIIAYHSLEVQVTHFTLGRLRLTNNSNCFQQKWLKNLQKCRQYIYFRDKLANRLFRTAKFQILTFSLFILGQYPITLPLLKYVPITSSSSYATQPARQFLPVGRALVVCLVLVLVWHINTL